MTVTDPKFGPLLDTLIDNLHHHIRHEKGEDMPCLEKLLLREESEALIFPSPSFFLRSHDSMDV
jgi:hypothetical protein